MWIDIISGSKFLLHYLLLLSIPILYCYLCGPRLRKPLRKKKKKKKKFR